MNLYGYRAAKGKNDYHPEFVRNGMKRPHISNGNLFLAGVVNDLFRGVGAGQVFKIAHDLVYLGHGHEAAGVFCDQGGQLGDLRRIDDT